jgi:hypothetical protein
VAPAVLSNRFQVFLMVAQILFWIVYTKDKLAKNEPWERNTRYYWYYKMYFIE